MALVGTFHSLAVVAKQSVILWVFFEKVLQVWSFLKDWSVDGAHTAAIARTRDAVEGCVPCRQITPTFTLEFGLE